MENKYVNNYTTPTAYRHFTAERWAELRADTPIVLSEQEVIDMRGRGEIISLDEVTMIYLPLSRLLNLYVGATQDLHRATSTFLGRLRPKVPYIIGLAGSVAVGKSTTGRILQALLAHWPNHPKVDLVTTDGFLYNNAVLEERQLMERKGFPESFDQKQLIAFLNDVKSGKRNVEAPVYSHQIYDIVPDEKKVIDQPDILIVEGLNVLQVPRFPSTSSTPPAVSDFFDFSIYLDADVKHIEKWYVERILNLRETAFRDPDAFFHGLAKISEQEAIDFAHRIWKSINEENLRANILPTRERAHLILRKNVDHAISDVYLRKL
ncbi:MAG: type I pantothenate kinase [Gammaproteobacteria bacterium]|jgi:type I pantothenate kinase